METSHMAISKWELSFRALGKFSGSLRNCGRVQPSHLVLKFGFYHNFPWYCFPMFFCLRFLVRKVLATLFFICLAKFKKMWRAHSSCRSQATRHNKALFWAERGDSWRETTSQRLFWILCLGTLLRATKFSGNWGLAKQHLELAEAGFQPG